MEAPSEISPFHRDVERSIPPISTVPNRKCCLHDYHPLSAIGTCNSVVYFVCGSKQPRGFDWFVWRFAFRGHLDSHIFLIRMEAGQENTNPSKPDQGPGPFRLNEVLGEKGAAMASRYAIRSLAGESQVEKLSLPEILEGVPKFSSNVSEVLIYEVPALQISCSMKDTTPQTIDADIKLLIPIADALLRKKK